MESINFSDSVKPSLSLAGRRNGAVSASASLCTGDLKNKMKLLTIALTALTLCGAALAAPVDIVTVRFATPVMIGEKTLPAGDVTFNVIHGNSSLLLTARAEDGTSALVMVSPLRQGDENAKSSVVLGKTGNTVKLERIWLDSGAGFAVANAQ
jgi:hypothetical protein